MRIIPNTKSNYLNLNGLSYQVKESVSETRYTCAIFSPELQKIVSVDFVPSEISIVGKRESGYYWVKPTHGLDFEIAEYSARTEKFYFSNSTNEKSATVYAIDENKIERKA